MGRDARPLVVATWVGIVVNACLAIAKAVTGLITHSQALQADAVHSASDIIGSVVALVAIKIANKPPDDDHPYGHGKAEHVASIVVALLLIVVGVQLAGSAVGVLLGQAPEPPGQAALVVIVVSIVVKELLFRYKLRIGRRYGSAALMAEAWHHRSDAYSSIAALIGVAGALAGARWGIDLLLYGDALAGMFVSLVIVKVGFTLAKQSSYIMMEQVLAEEEVEKFTRTAASVAGVTRVDQLLARSHGRYVIINIRIGVDPHITVEAGHAIGKRVKETLIATHPEVQDVLVHLNP